MSKPILGLLVCAAVLFSVSAFGVDGVVLINQSTVTRAGGFPYKITNPGSYKLSGNLSVPASTNGIDILTDDVTLDLNGFTIRAPKNPCPTVPCSASSQGILSNFNNTTVRNGKVRAFEIGVNVGVPGKGGLVEEIQAFDNLVGIQVIDGVVRGSTASRNTDRGIISDFATVTGNVANGNGGDGIDPRRSTVTQNTAIGNGGDGILAIESTVTENVAAYNGNLGLLINRGVFGSNTFESNVGGTAVGGVSQGNNDCNGSAC
jgi:hypothetical protein